jgi:ribosome-associated toxin RatA of RatAB toxin-antitoxin module
MPPITFQYTRLIPYAPAEIAAAIVDMSRWPEFTGYGPMPGIASAEFETRTPEMTGSRIQVHNTDGSSHVETIEVWQPPETITLRLHEFSPPISRLADHFLEIWRFTPGPEGTRTTRQMQLYPRSPATRPLLWLISLMLRRAIAAHLEQMASPTPR